MLIDFCNTLNTAVHVQTICLLIMFLSFARSLTTYFWHVNNIIALAWSRCSLTVVSIRYMVHIRAIPPFFEPLTSANDSSEDAESAGAKIL